MGKKKGTRKSPNKAKAIREYKAKFPDAKPTQVSEELSKKGLDVSPEYASTILSNERRGFGYPKVTNSEAGDFSLNDMYFVRQFIAKMGGVKEAHRAIDSYRRLMI